ncbi:hypothetical protein [Kribbella sp. NPDC051718]|uniref:hypothetical protein n=1 Tax=Kribbella sp. NPDC051718 TaxID=3155168 RepID=UPI0034251A37
MTLHIGIATHARAIQAGDRLLTLGKEPWDPVANQTIILIADNATATISYSGLSFIGKDQTDHWLAEKIAGEVFDEHHGSPPITIGGDRKITLGSAANAIATGIATEFRSLPKELRKQNIQVLFSGFTWKRIRKATAFRPRPFLWYCEYDEKRTSHIKGWRSPRWWGHNDPYYTKTVGASIQERVVNAVGQISSSAMTMAEVELGIRDLIRDISEGRPTVGDECYVTTIERDQRVRVCFMRANESKTPENSIYTPWILGSSINMPPQLLAGMIGVGVESRGRSVDFFSIPELKQAARRSLTGQVRKTWP